MKLKDITNFDRFEKNPFLNFLIVVIAVCVTSYVLAMNSAEIAVFIGFYAFAGSAFGVCLIIYFLPWISDRLSPQNKIARQNPGKVLLRGINGELPKQKERDMEKFIRRTKF